MKTHQREVLKAVPQAVVSGLFALSALVGLGEDLTISSATYVADGAKSYANVTVTCASTVSGTLNLDDGATLAVSSGTAAITANVRFGATAAGKVTLAPASGASAVFTGTLSGPAALDVNGEGSVSFTTDNGSFDGNLTVTQGAFHAKGKGAFGTTNGYTRIVGSKTASISFDGVTTAEDIRLTQGGDWGVASVKFTDTCTFNGPFSASASRWEWWVMATGKTITFNGPFSGFNALMGDDYGHSSTVTWNISPAFDILYWRNGTVNFNKPMNLTGKSGYDHVRVRGDTLYNLNCADVFGTAAYASDITWEDGNCLNRPSTFNLAGNDQHARSFVNGAYSATTTFTSVQDATLRLLSPDTSGSQEFNGCFTGRAGLSVEGPLPLTLSGTNTTLGTLSLKGGARVTFAAGASWAGGVSFASSTGAEKLTLTSGTNSVSGLWIDGARVARGTYGSADSAAEHKLACFAGVGVLEAPVEPLAVTGDLQVPDEGIVCSGVTVTGAATISGGPITVVGDAQIYLAANATFAAPLVLGEGTEARQVKIVPVAGVKGTFTGAISGPSHIDIAAVGETGAVVFSGANTFDGNLTVTKGVFTAAGDGAFGSTAGTTYMKCTTTKQSATPDCKIVFEGVTTTEAITLTQGGAWGVSSVVFNGTSVFNGPFRAAGWNNEWWSFGAGADVTFNGEFSGFQAILGGDMGARDQIVTWRGYTSFQRHYWLAGPVNHFSPIAFPALNDRDYLRVRGATTYNLSCADVFGSAATCARMQWENADATSRVTTFNLVSNDLHIAYLYNGAYSKGTTVRSETDGVTFHLMSDKSFAGVTSSQRFDGVFAGKVGLSVEGSLPLTLNGANTSSGTLTLTNGARVAFGAGANWAGSIDVRLGADEAERLTLAGGLSVGELRVNGTPVASGSYGAPGSGAAKTLPFLAGEGLLHVALGELVIEGDTVLAAAGEDYSGVRVTGAATVSGGPLRVWGVSTIAVGADATFACPVALMGTSCAISPAAFITATFTGEVSGNAPIEILAADVSGRVNFRGANTFDGELKVTRGDFHAYGDAALGSTKGRTYFLGTGDASARRYDNLITFHAMRTAENVAISDGFGVAWWNACNIFFDGTNVFTGAWTPSMDAYTEFGWIFLPASETTFAGSLKGFRNLFGHNYGAVARSHYDDEPRGVINFNGTQQVSGNWYGCMVIYNYNAPFTAGQMRFRGGTHNLNCANALVSSGAFIFESDQKLRVNLNGGDQDFHALGDGTDLKNSKSATFASGSGRTLRLKSARTSQYDGVFAGNVNVSAECSGAVVRLGGVSTSTGTLTARNGAAVTLLAGGAWAGDVAVGAGSTLTLQGQALNRTANVTLTGDAKVTAAAGLTARCGYVTVDGVKIPGGVYSATEGDARYRAHFTGEGRVKVRGAGCVVILK